MTLQERIALATKEKSITTVNGDAPAVTEVDSKSMEKTGKTGISIM